MYLSSTRVGQSHLFGCSSTSDTVSVHLSIVHVYIISKQVLQSYTFCNRKSFCFESVTTCTVVTVTLLLLYDEKEKISWH